MSKVVRSTKPLGISRSHSFSTAVTAKPVTKVGLKVDTGTNDNDVKNGKKKTVKTLEVDTLRRRKLALSRDQVKVAKVSPVRRDEVKSRESTSPEKSNVKRVTSIRNVSSNGSNTLPSRSNVSKVKITNKLNFVNNNKVTKNSHDVAGQGRKSPLKAQSSPESLLLEDHDRKSILTKVKVNLPIFFTFSVVYWFVLYTLIV